MPSSTCAARSREGSSRDASAVARGLERIGVVARHDGALGRQRAYEMRVAVIDDVKDVEVAALRPKPARIVPEPSRQPVAELRAAAAADNRQPRPSPNHRRTQPRRDDVAAGDRRQQSRAACRRRDPCCASLLRAGRRRRRRARRSSTAGAPSRRRQINHTCVARPGPSHENGLATTRVTSNCWLRRSWSTRQLKPL